MEPAEQLEYFVHRARQAGLVPGADPEAGRHVFQVFQENIKAVHDYRPNSYPGKVTLFRPVDQTKTNELFDDPRLGWGEWTEGGVEVVHVPGDHAHMVHEPAVAELAKKLKQCLAKAEDDQPADDAGRQGRQPNAS
jgi:thioesterase domain-containing protein